MNELDVLILGEIRLHLVVEVERLPAAGETLMGRALYHFAGGKGANQAVAVARLGGRAGLVGKAGADAFGDELENSLRGAGLGELRLSRSDRSPTGIALAAVDASGQSELIVVPGANAELSPEEVRQARDLFARSRVVLLQLGATPEAVTEAIGLARDFRKLVILNLGSSGAAPQSLLQAVDFVTANSSELEVLAGRRVTDKSSAELAAAILVEKGVRNVVVTLGAEGCLFWGPEGRLHVPTARTEAADRPAAQDVFHAAFALTLARGETLRRALEFANAAAALTTTRPGGQASAPTHDEVREFLENVSASSTIG